MTRLVEIRKAKEIENKKVKSKEYKNQKIINLINNRDVDLDFYKEIVNNFLNVSSSSKKQVFKEAINFIN